MTLTRCERIVGFPVTIERLDSGSYHASTAIEDGRQHSSIANTKSEALGALVEATYRTRQEWVMKRAKYKCENCARRLGLTVHHKILRSHGRDDRMQNLAALCRQCHDLKHRR